MLPNFFVGVVEDVNDPLKLGRVRVRYLKIHTDNLVKLPTSMLPWSDVLSSINSASISGVGTAPVGMVQGTMVASLPLDDGYQQFLVLGTLPGNRSVYINSSYGFNDPDGNYPISGINGDINILAGGSANTGSTNTKTANTIPSSTIPGSTDPTATTTPSGVADTDTVWMPVAVSQLGINQTANPDIVQQYLTIGGGITTGGIVAWCASFANWCLSQVNIKGTRSASARSFLNYGVSVGTDNVPYGAIAVFGVPNSGSGHVGFVIKDNGTTLTIIGGNQTDHSASRSGGIVSQTNFPKNSSTLQLLDCRMPTTDLSIGN